MLPGIKLFDLTGKAAIVTGGSKGLGEAMAAGVPVIAARCDFGPDEIVDDGQTGLLAERENVEALAQAIDQLLADADLRAELGTKGQVAIRRYAPDTVAMQWDDALNRAVRRS